MTATATDEQSVKPVRARLLLALAAVITVPGIVLRVTSPDIPHPAEALLFGLAIVGAAFVLSWGAEAAQLDISAGLAIALLALIAVLPEYAVDFVFADKAGHAVAEFGSRCAAANSGSASPCSLALANMTGANRLLIGVGWSMVAVLAWWRWRKRGESVVEVKLERSNSVEIAYLTVACLYSLTLPLKRTVTLVTPSSSSASSWRTPSASPARRRRRRTSSARPPISGPSRPPAGGLRWSVCSSSPPP